MPQSVEIICKSENKKPERKSFGFFGAPAGIRTPDTLLKRQVLCRLSYWIIHIQLYRTTKVAGTAGFEPANVGVKGRCLTAWRRPHIRHSKQLYPKDNALRLQRVTGLYGVGKGTRTLDPRNHNPML